MRATKQAVWTIGQLAKQAGVNVQTIHYYERRDILKPAARRDPSGYRIYNKDALRRLRFIKNAQALGFSLAEIHGLLRLQLKNTARCGDVKAKAQKKLDDVQGKIRRLQSISRVLAELVSHCIEERPTEACPILNSLDFIED